MQTAVRVRKNQIEKTFKNKTAAEIQEILDIFNIFRSNSDCCNQPGTQPQMTTSLGIQSSRFNHSCRSNAERSVCRRVPTKDEKELVKEDKFVVEDYEIRATSKIKAGEEITVNYFWLLSMMNR